MESIPFGLAALVTLFSALRVVRSPNLVHAALWLGLALLGTAALFAVLGASFLAGVQVLLYIGGVMTLTLVGIMITRRHDGLNVPAESIGHVRAGVVSVALFAVLAWAISATPGLDAGPLGPDATTQDIGHALVGTHVLAFEVVSMLLLAAMLGAIVIARRKDPAPHAVTHLHVPATAVREAAE